MSQRARSSAGSSTWLRTKGSGVRISSGAPLLIASTIYAPVAQLDRVLGFEPRGQEFESLRARQFNKKLNKKYLKIAQNEITKEQNIFLISNKI